eukprot:365682-Chlamydomonas_euryale.AAC.8
MGRESGRKTQDAYSAGRAQLIQDPEAEALQQTTRRNASPVATCNSDEAFGPDLCATQID